MVLVLTTLKLQVPEGTIREKLGRMDWMCVTAPLNQNRQMTNSRLQWLLPYYG